VYTREYLARIWELHHGKLSAQHRQSFLARPELAQLLNLPRAELDRVFRANRRLVDIVAAASVPAGSSTDVSPEADAVVAAEADLAWREHEAAQAAEAAKALAASKANEDAWADEQARRLRAEDARAEAGEADHHQREPAAQDEPGRGTARLHRPRDRDDEISELIWLMLDGPGHEYPRGEYFGLYGSWDAARSRSVGYHTKGRDGPYSGGYPFDSSNADDAW